jgi:hypothetical protein
MKPSDQVLCHCGKPLHYSDPRIQAMVEELVQVKGQTIVVTIGKRSWRVQRHYIALHGIRGWELPGLGFEEIKNVT